ncbi:MAG: hypothetical protein F4Y24_15295 [Gemmatimonadetes bacterium]|nr:hypothetical protein [Gemmatimonadota bacterium]MYG20825.1 hypothetical protein [Gemmatimonadota bacterium]MYJ40563.1 hypothetical protein [Gemmatimonadota bacterium]
MTVGDTEADPLFEVTGIAITESHVVIAQESEGTLRFYDRDGSLEKTVGGRGEGPGEYGGLDWMRRVGGHLFAYDVYGREVSRYSLDGRLLGTVALSPPEEYLPGLSALGVFPDGSVLAEKWYLHWPTRPEVARAPVALLLFDDEGAFEKRLLDMAGPEIWYEPVGTTRHRQMMRFFGRISHVAVVDSVFAVLENDSYDIPLYGPDGVVRDTLRPAVLRGLTPLPRFQADFAQQVVLDSWDAELGSGRGEVERSLAAMGPPEHLPPYGWLSLMSPHHSPMTTADGLVWALRYGGLPREDGDMDGPEWFVLQPGVGQIATLSSPDNVVLVDVAGEMAAVIRRTDLGEEIVELRRIVGR